MISTNIRDKKSVSSEYLKFLDTYPWTHFGTFTTRDQLSANASRKLTQKIAAKLPKTNQQANLQMFWAAEQFKSGDGYHLYCLIICHQESIINQLKIWYEKTYGYCKILPKRDRASSFLAKNIMHNRLTEYGFI